MAMTRAMGRMWAAGVSAALVLGGPMARSGPAAAAVQAGMTSPVAAGEAIYRTHCASCHGISGTGDGPVSEFLRIPVADLTRIALRNNGVFPSVQVQRIIDGRQRVRGHGSTEMPVWGDTLGPTLVGPDAAATQRRIEDLVAYLERLQRKLAE